MKKYKEIQETIIKKDVIKQSCDFCGKELSTQKDILLGDITSFEIHFEYGSKYDGDIKEFDICDNCYDKIFKNKYKV